MSDLTDVGLLFVVGLVLSFLLLPEWANELVIFGGQAAITFGVWAGKVLVRRWLRRRALRGIEEEKEDERE